MSLLPIHHEHRLASPADAAAWFRALGEQRVSARGFHTIDPARFERLVDAIEPSHEHTISFVGGTLGATARDALDALATRQFHYLDVRTVDASLRVWPELYSWVHSSRDLAAATAAVGAPLVVGVNLLGDVQVTLTSDSRGYPISVETKTRATALRVFHALSGERVNRGFINGVHGDTKPYLTRLLTVLATQVDAVLEVDVASARALTELYAGEPLDWQAGGLLVDFPEGRIHGFLTTPHTSQGDQEKWQSRVTKALRRASLL